VLLGLYAPPAVLISPDLEVRQIRGDTGPYLLPASGKAGQSLKKMAREGLLVPLRVALEKARTTRTAVRDVSVRIKSTDGYRDVSLHVRPIRESADAPESYLVLFEPRDPAPRPAAAQGGAARAGRASGAGAQGRPQEPAQEDGESGETTAQRAERLELELTATREYLQAVIQQQEEDNDDLQAGNEEAQSSNEELQSLNEELETSKEELQSTSEELASLNDELNHRNDHLSRLNDDLQNLLRSAQMAIVMVEADLRIRRYSPRAEKLLRLVPSDVGRPIGDVRFHLGVTDIERLVSDVITSGLELEREVREEQGPRYSMRIHPFRTVDGRIDGAVITIVDVEALTRAKEFAHAIVTTVRQPFLVLDSELRIASASPRFHETFAISAAETEGRLLHELPDWDIPELRRLLEVLLPQDTTIEGFVVERTFRRIGRKTMIVNARRLQQAHGEPALILLSIEDATVRKDLEHTLRTRVEELALADQGKTHFLAMLSHELRNPLAALSNAAAALERPDLGVELEQQSAALIKRQVGMMTRLVDDLLDVSRVTRGRIVFRPERVALGDVIQRAVEMTSHLVRAGRQELVVSVPAEPIVIRADPVRLEQAVANLITNASRYGGHGGHIWITAEQHPETAERASTVLIRVRDDGMGIAPEMLPRIFDLFVQADNSLARTKGGLGIGLTLARSLVELHGGSLQATSAGLGQGSEFVICMPPLGAEAGDPPACQDASAPSAAAAAGKSARRVLVVDDNLDVLESMAMLLRLEGHDVHAVKDGPEALATAEVFAPEVVLLDLGLPGMDGYKVARRLRQHPALASAMIVAVTGHGSDLDRSLSREAGIDLHITKPADPDLLRELLRAPPKSPG
jgi:two-component system CheB/CheR fusion protein